MMLIFLAYQIWSLAPSGGRVAQSLFFSFHNLLYSRGSIRKEPKTVFQQAIEPKWKIASIHISSNCKWSFKSTNNLKLSLLFIRES
ncbi:hypothetical protein L6452_06714 [Arctium lappa]|uniref:Uncharacterized protein n=1 Tax=Arctium lappa TaxID=4217 RepID=A0ACB9EJN5_ARCLA|nr:hypothetical protein L6452_06714 [Arctium lappa]